MSVHVCDVLLVPSHALSLHVGEFRVSVLVCRCLLAGRPAGSLPVFVIWVQSAPKLEVRLCAATARCRNFAPVLFIFINYPTKRERIGVHLIATPKEVAAG